MKKILMGEPFVCECPHCGELVVTSVMFGSGAFCCPKCSQGQYEPIRFDFVPREEIKKNQEKYKDLIEQYLNNDE